MSGRVFDGPPLADDLDQALRAALHAVSHLPLDAWTAPVVSTDDDDGDAGTLLDDDTVAGAVFLPPDVPEVMWDHRTTVVEPTRTGYRVAMSWPASGELWDVSPARRLVGGPVVEACFTGGELVVTFTDPTPTPDRIVSVASATQQHISVLVDAVVAQEAAWEARARLIVTEAVTARREALQLAVSLTDTA